MMGRRIVEISSEMGAACVWMILQVLGMWLEDIPSAMEDMIWYIFKIILSVPSRMNLSR